ncbi:MAG: hypothetical protein SOV68_08935, partial [Ligilactobacillus salivarius]|nr:hypothetical protein [Ligilactobacillus salivarius]
CKSIRSIDFNNHRYCSEGWSYGSQGKSDTGFYTYQCKYQHISPREELIKRARELHKAVYAVAPDEKEKMPKKRESSGLLEDEIEYCNELSEVIDADSRMEVIETLREQNNYLKEGVADTQIEIEY